MSNVTSNQLPSEPPLPASASSATRVDGAHVPVETPAEVMMASSPSAEVLHKIAGQSSEPLSEQLQRQATELANHLRSQQQGLDQRESELNAHFAQLDNELRSTRLMLRERQEELEQHEAELGQRAKQLDQRATAVAAAEVATERAMEAKENEFRRIQQETVKRWRQALEGKPGAARPRVGKVSPEEATLAGAVNAAADRLRQREQMLDESENLLKTQLEKMANDRRQLQEERVRMKAQLREDQRRLSELRQSVGAELDAKRQALDRRKNELQRRRKTLEQLHGEVTRLHRESLEMRLVTEQLWARLSAETAAPELTSTLGELRSKLADHYRLANQSLAERQRELQELGSKLNEQKKKTLKQQQELQQWARLRTEDAEQQAARLMARERKLAKRETELQRLQQQQEQERRKYEQKIRDLMSRLRQQEPLLVAG